MGIKLKTATTIMVSIILMALKVQASKETNYFEPDDHLEQDLDYSEFSDESDYEIIVRSKTPLSRDLTQDETLMDGDFFRDSTRHSTLEAISSKDAGVYVSGRGVFHGISNGASGGIHIRGLGGSPNSQVLIVENGIPDFMGIFGHPIADAYLPFLIDEVLVIKGGDSVLYGTNAMGGVLVFRSRWLETDGVEFENNAAFGSYHTIKEQATVLGRTDKFDFASSLNVTSSQGHRPGAGGNLAALEAAGRYKFNKNFNLTVREKIVHLKGTDPGPVNHPNVDNWYEVWRNNSSVSLSWNNNLANFRISPYFNMGIHRLHDGFYSNDFVLGNIAEADILLNSQTDVIIGLDANHINGIVKDRVKSEDRPVIGQTSVSTYTQITFRPIDSVFITGGGRLMNNSEYGMIPLYKIGIRWNAPLGIYFHTRFAKNFRQPTLRELYLPFPTANPQLRPEYSLNWDFTLGYNHKHFEISGTIYRTHAKDMIRYFGSWPTAEVVNIDNMHIWGVEGKIALNNIGPFCISVNADWKDTKRYTRQNPDAKVNWEIQSSKHKKNHSFFATLTGEWIHGLYMSNYHRNQIEDTFSMDLAFRYRYTQIQRQTTIEPYLFLRNFLDRDYAYVENYPMPGFNILAGLKIGI
jgi:outer membrane cobalamin receptor